MVASRAANRKDPHSLSNSDKICSTHVEFSLIVNFDEKRLIGWVEHSMLVKEEDSVVIFDTNGSLEVTKAEVEGKGLKELGGFNRRVNFGYHRTLYACVKPYLPDRMAIMKSTSMELNHLTRHLVKKYPTLLKRYSYASICLPCCRRAVGSNRQTHS